DDYAAESAEEQVRFNNSGRLVVQQIVIPPRPNQFGHDYSKVAAGMSTLEVGNDLFERSVELAIGGINDKQLRRGNPGCRRWRSDALFPGVLKVHQRLLVVGDVQGIDVRRNLQGETQRLARDSAPTSNRQQDQRRLQVRGVQWLGGGDL